MTSRGERSARREPPGCGSGFRTPRRQVSTFRASRRAENVVTQAQIRFFEGEPCHPSKRSNNIAARMGRWSASHWKTAVFGWLAFVVASLAVGMQVGTKQLDQRRRQRRRVASRRADPEATPGSSPTRRRSSSSSRARSSRRTTRRSRPSSARPSAPSGPSRRCTNLRSPLDPGHGDLVSDDGRTVMVQWEMKGKLDEAEKKIDPILAATARVAQRASGLLRRRGRRGQLRQGADAAFGEQLAQAGERSIPLTLIVLLLVFGAVVAATVPLIVALTGVAATIGLLAIPSHIVPMDQNVSAVSCSSASPSASTTRSSTSSASARSAPPAGPTAPRSRQPRRRRAAPCSSRASP